MVRENVSENVIRLKDQPRWHISDHRAKLTGEKEGSHVSFLRGRCINNKMRKWKLQGNNYQVPKQWGEMYVVYFHKIHLRSMAHHLEPSSYRELLLKQTVIPLSCLIRTFKFKTSVCFALFYFSWASLTSKEVTPCEGREEPLSLAFWLHRLQLEINRCRSVLWVSKEVYFSLQLISAS